MEEIKHCPFCAGRAYLTTILPDNRVAVKCEDCDCQTWEFSATPAGRESAIRVWNRRDGDRCAAGCAVKKAIREFSESLGEE